MYLCIYVCILINAHHTLVFMKVMDHFLSPILSNVVYQEVHVPLLFMLIHTMLILEALKELVMFLQANTELEIISATLF